MGGIIFILIGFGSGYFCVDFIARNGITQLNNEDVIQLCFASGFRYDEQQHVNNSSTVDIVVTIIKQIINRQLHSIQYAISRSINKHINAVKWQ